MLIARLRLAVDLCTQGAPRMRARVARALLILDKVDLAALFKKIKLMELST